MSTLDIRGVEDSPVDKILFADLTYNNYATCLRLSHGEITLQVDDSGDYESAVIAKSSIENLIKALQKAVDLGWTK